MTGTPRQPKRVFVDMSHTSAVSGAYVTTSGVPRSLEKRFVDVKSDLDDSSWVYFTGPGGIQRSVHTLARPRPRPPARTAAHTRTLARAHA